PHAAKTAMPNFGDILRRERKAAGLSATALAKLLRRTQSYISQLESGALHPPDDDCINDIANFLKPEPKDELQKSELVATLFLAAARLPPEVIKTALLSYEKDPEGTDRWLKESATGAIKPSLSTRHQIKERG